MAGRAIFVSQTESVDKGSQFPVVKAGRLPGTRRGAAKFFLLV